MNNRLRWVAIGVFLFSSTLNYLDRQLLAAVAPLLRGEFHLTNEDYGLLLTGFSVLYALAAPFAGLFIDRVGLNAGISTAVAVWSLAGMSTGFANGLGGLLASRAALGAAEAAGVPGTGKANATYLAPQELALGTAASQIGLEHRRRCGAAAGRVPRAVVWVENGVRRVRSLGVRVDPHLAIYLAARSQAAGECGRRTVRDQSTCCRIAASGRSSRRIFST